jgi:hypothetical protein
LPYPDVQDLKRYSSIQSKIIKDQTLSPAARVRGWSGSIQNGFEPIAEDCKAIAQTCIDRYGRVDGSGKRSCHSAHRVCGKGDVRKLHRNRDRTAAGCSTRKPGGLPPSAGTGRSRPARFAAVNRLVRDSHGCPVQLLHGLYRPDRYEYRMDLSRSGDGEARVWHQADGIKTM